MQHTPGVLYIQGVLLLVASQAPCLPTKVATVTTLRRFVPKKREARSGKAERVKIADATLSSSNSSESSSGDLNIVNIMCC